MATTKNDKLPDIREMSDGQIVNAIGEVRDAVKQFQVLEKWYTNGLKARYPEEATIVGATHTAHIEIRVQNRLNTTKIRKEMTDEWIEEYSSQTESVVCSIKPKAQGDAS